MIWVRRMVAIVATSGWAVASGGREKKLETDLHAGTKGKSLDFADGLGLLPEFRRVFELIGELPADSNGDKALSKTEIVSRYGSEGVSRVMPLDSSRDGRVTASEAHESCGSCSEREFEAVFGLISRFPADIDGDGKLSLEELSEHYGMEASASIGVLDSDGDGKVSLGELRFGRRSDHELSYDADGDGSVSRLELTQRGWTETETEQVMMALDSDSDGSVEAYEVVEGLASKRAGRDPASARFLKGLGGINFLTPRAEVRRMWAVLKDLACGTQTPCLDPLALKNLLERQNDTACGANATMLTADEFEAAAAQVLVPLANVSGDIAFEDFVIFAQSEVPANISAAVSHLIDARGFAMARSLILQQLVVAGLKLHLPSVVEEAAATRYVFNERSLAAKRPEIDEDLLLYNSTIQWSAYVTVMTCILTYIYCVANQGPPHIASRTAANSAYAIHHTGCSSKPDVSPASNLARHQIARIYFNAAYTQHKKVLSQEASPLLEHLFKPSILDDADQLSEDIKLQAAAAGKRDAPSLHQATDKVASLAANAISNLYTTHLQTTQTRSRVD